MNMLRVLSIALLVTLLLPLSLKFTVLADYMMRYKHYAMVLCENKENSEMKCNGKCQLSKGLAKASQSEEKNTIPEIPSQANVEISFFIVPFNNRNISNRSDLELNLVLKQPNSHYFRLHNNTVFRPPIFI